MFKKEGPSSKKKTAGSSQSSMFAIDPKLFELPEVEPVPVVNLHQIMSGLDKDVVDVHVADDDIDENDPALLAELAHVQRGGDEEEGNEQEDKLVSLKRELEEEREAMQLFEKEGCTDEAQELLPKIRDLEQQIAELTKSSQPASETAKERYEQLRLAAVAWNRAGNKQRAMEYLKKAKEMESSHVVPDEPEFPPTKETPAAAAAPPPVPPRPSTPPELLSARNSLDALRSSRALRRATDQKKWDVLLSTLKEEVKTCNAAALKWKDKDKVLAVNYFRRQKESLAMLEKGTMLKDAGTPPPHNWDSGEVVQWKRIVSNAEVADESMLVILHKGKDLAEGCNAFVKLIYSYRPKEEGEDAVSTFQNLNGSQMVLPIQRKKSFQRWLERKDLRFELWESRGFFRGGDQLMGRVDVPMEPLLQQCTIRGVFPVLLNRKKVGPSLEISILLKTPLLAPQEEVIEEKWIRVPQWPDPGRGPEDARDDAEEARLVAEIDKFTSAAAPPPKDPFAIDESADNSTRLEDPDRFQSVALLQHLAVETSRRISELRRDQKDASQEIVLLSRIQQREAALREWLQLDNMTPDQYAQIVEKAVASESHLALQLKKKGQQAEALRCMARVKVMKLELSTRNEKPQPVQPDPPVQPKPVAPKPSPPPAAPNVRHLDRIVSVGVIDWELEALKGKDDEESITRRGDLELKKQMMMMQINMGTLTVEDYAAALQKSIASDMAMAKKLKDEGKKEDALYCLARAKVMQKELEN